MSTKKCANCEHLMSCDSITERICLTNGKSMWKNIYKDAVEPKEWDLESAREDYKREVAKKPSCRRCKFFKYRDLPKYRLFGEECITTEGYCRVSEQGMPPHGDLSDDCKYYTYRNKEEI